MKFLRSLASAFGIDTSPRISADDVIGNVKRARLGDQNAQGYLQELGDHARKGAPWAQAPQKVVLAYLAQNPVESADIGAESGGALSALTVPLDPDGLLKALCFLPHAGDCGTLEAAIVLLCHGPGVSTGKIGELQARVPQQNLPAFRQGLAFAGEDETIDAMAKIDPGNLSYLCAGHCLGMARRIQQVRDGAPFDTFSADIGWELDAPIQVPRRGFNK
jgi:hypothetical protein